MDAPDQKARDKDRAAAVALVGAALASGRIVQADHDMRVQALKSARTLQDIDIQTRDLAPPTAASTLGWPPPVTPVAPVAPVAGAPAGPPPVPSPAVSVGPIAPGAAPASGGPVGGPPPAVFVEYGRPQSVHLGSSGRGRSGGSAASKVGAIIVAVVLVAVVVPVIAAVAIFVGSSKDIHVGPISTPTDSTTYRPGQPPGPHGVNVFTVAGYQALAAAVTAETGSTKVFDATIYPRYAVLQLPVSASGRHEELYYWDGSKLSSEDSKGTATGGAVDLATLDPAVLVRLLNRERRILGDATTWYAVFGTFGGGDPELAVYATNDFSESAYVIATPDGTITYDSKPAK